MHVSSSQRAKPRAIVAAHAFLAVLALACCAPPARAGLNCGDMPILQPASIVPAVQTDVQEKVEIIRAHALKDRRRFIVAQRQDMRAKYPQIDPVLLDSYVLWTTCQSIEDDKNLAPAQAFDEYSDLYRQLSEPIKAPEHAE